MLNEKRVLHMSRMEMRRIKESAEIAPFINVDKKDYLSYKRISGFVIGSIFYGIAVFFALVFVFGVLLPEISRAMVILAVVLSIIGYIAFMYQYQNWTHRHTLSRINIARKKIKRLRKDWDTLEEIYGQEEQDASPEVDMDILFPEGSLGENE